MGNRYSASENSYRCLQQSTKRIINVFLCKLDGSLSPFRLIPNVVLFRCLTEIYFGLFVCDMEVSSDIDCRFQTTKKVNSCYPRGVHLVRLRQMHVWYDKLDHKLEDKMSSNLWERPAPLNAALVALYAIQ